MKYSVFTLTTPDYDTDEILDKLQQFGYDGVEWRVTELSSLSSPPSSREEWFHKYNKCTVDIQRLDELADSLRANCERKGLEIVSLGSYLTTKEFDAVSRVMSVAERIGCGKVRVKLPSYSGKMPYRKLFDDSCRELDALIPVAERTGVQIVVEVHHRTIMPSCSAAYRLVSHFDPKHVGVIHDAGNMVIEGNEGMAMGLDVLGPYLAHVHLKNAHWKLQSSLEDGTERWGTEMSPLRAGIVDQRELAKLLVERGYDGYVSFEDFSTVHSTEVSLRDNIAYMKAIFASLASDN
ncbi:MAG: Xylose isomerase domain protein barrel [Paenibacillus sp.]|nr:Xylose isomerase domain protein barrel [Paenibacillus sp.]